MFKRSIATAAGGDLPSRVRAEPDVPTLVQRCATASQLPSATEAAVREHQQWQADLMTRERRLQAFQVAVRDRVRIRHDVRVQAENARAASVALHHGALAGAIYSDGVVRAPSPEREPPPPHPLVSATAATRAQHGTMLAAHALRLFDNNRAARRQLLSCSQAALQFVIHDRSGREGDDSAALEASRVAGEERLAVSLVAPVWTSRDRTPVTTMGDTPHVNLAAASTVSVAPMLPLDPADRHDVVALSRRLFAASDRQRVREEAGEQRHQRRFHELRAAAETERRRVEQQWRRESVGRTRPAHCASAGDEDVDAADAADLAAREVAQTAASAAAQHAVEADRFARALRFKLVERIKFLGIELPPLCSCGKTFWDTNPDTCAMNCPFYRNKQAYAQALSAVFNAYNITS